MSVVDEMWEVLHGPDAAKNFDILMAGSIIGISKLWLTLSQEDRVKMAVAATGVTILDAVMNSTPAERRYVQGLVTKRIDQKVKELSG